MILVGPFKLGIFYDSMKNLRIFASQDIQTIKTRIILMPFALHFQNIKDKGKVLVVLSPLAASPIEALQSIPAMTGISQRQQIHLLFSCIAWCPLSEVL